MSELIAVDVSEDFIDAVVGYVKKWFKDGMEKVTVLFPNRRAVRFFEARIVSPILLHIEASSLEDYARKTVSSISDPSPSFQLDLDRYLMLHSILEQHSHLYQRLGGSIERVFPWCIHLSDLFDEFDRHLIRTVAPLQYIDEVVPEAREILKNLDILYRSYRKLMESLNLTYHGDMFLRLNALKERLSGPFVLAGFSLLTRAQREFFVYLFKKRQTAVLFHTDLVGRHPDTDTYRIYDSWENGTYWGKRPVSLNNPASSPKPTRLSFWESFDTHSEANQAAEGIHSILNKKAPINSPLDVGIVLPDSQMLFPIVYSLTSLNTPMNITLGFPFERSVFYRLIDTMTALVLTRHEKRGFYHVHLLAFLSHPFVRSLKIEGAPFEETARKLQHGIVTRNLSFVRFETLKVMTDLTEKELRQFRWICDEILFPLCEARTMGGIGEILTRFISAFKDTVSAAPDLDLERQMIQNFLDRVMPNLTSSRNSERRFLLPEILFRIFRQLLKPLHVPFEGNPLEGIQVMGMLESRLLNFSHLFILDVNEGILPRGVKVDPLFPPSLNRIVGLPSVKERESLFRYHFFRLIDGSRDVQIFYQKGESGEEKRVRSRYVEQLLLEEEIRRSREGDVSPVRSLEVSLVNTSGFNIPPLHKPDRRKPAFYEARLRECLEGAISPTLLDEYLGCPYRFYLHKILGMGEEVTVQERQDAITVGKMIHRILQEAFSDVVGKSLTLPLLKDIRGKALNMINPFTQAAFPTLSTLRIGLLERLAHHRLRGFFSYTEREIQAHCRVKIHGIEESLRSNLNGYLLKGKADRIDEIDEGPDIPKRWRIIDYKTGQSARIPSRDFPDFLEDFNLSDYSGEALYNLRRHIRSIQLPMYIYLFRKTVSIDTTDGIEAVLLQLGKPEEEIASSTYGGSKISQERVEDLILYILNHMRYSEEITPFDSPQCPSCPYIKVCKHTLRSQHFLI